MESAVFYQAVNDPHQSAAEIERETTAMVRELKRTVRIRLGVKLSPFFTSFAHFALQLDHEGANGLVLFNPSTKPTSMSMSSR